jgi:ribonuclease HI
MSDTVDLITDGACRGNPGPGGWGVILRFKNKEKTLCGGELNTTNNRMEMTAVIKGLSELKRASRVKIKTDSKYVQHGMTEWLSGWKARGWKTAAKKPVKNVDLWKILDVLVSKHEVTWTWVKGHSGDPDNERADALANQGVDDILS